MKPASQILENRAAVSIPDEDAFFAKLRLPNGTFKTTGNGRLVPVDKWLMSHLPTSDLRLLDVAVSSGITTVDLMDALQTTGHRATVTACDLCINGYIRTPSPGFELLFDSRGHVLQLCTPFGVRGRPHNPQGSLARTALASVIRAVEWKSGMQVSGPRASDRPVQLVSQRLKARKDVEIVEHDLFQVRPAWAGQFDVIRAANILNQDYFDDAQLSHLVRVLGGYLRTNGLLLVARTNDAGETVASLVRLTDSGQFELVDRYGAGSGIESLVLAARVGG